MHNQYFKKGISLFIFSFLLLTHFAGAQQKFTISGYLKDASSGESLIAATVGVKGTTTGTSSNDYGFFSITLPKRNYALTFSYLGYFDLDTTVNLQGDIRLNINLKSEAQMLK
ncbi:MAG: carboxypeptidase-like regulatory domain-containing protein, partial [Chitinophagales bacterium]|nr:carboxypeptidase-like regulatory domain-containing protein [Chitinophagales bacterium]